MRIFISRQRPCSTFPQNRLDRVGFLGIKGVFRVEIRAAKRCPPNGLKAKN
jgi:hypothetical protein